MAKKQKPIKDVIQVKDLVALLLQEDQDADVALTGFEITGWLNSFGGVKRGTYKTGDSSEKPGEQRRFVGLDMDRYGGTLNSDEDDVNQED